MKKKILKLFGIEVIYDDSTEEKYKSVSREMDGCCVGLLIAGGIVIMFGIIGLLTKDTSDTYTHIKYCVELFAGVIIMFMGWIANMATEIYSRQEHLIAEIEKSGAGLLSSKNGASDCACEEQSPEGIQATEAEWIKK